jgi:hypothetical protein
MDELEISGKRYISARRAAKEYKYHSDYIGQLIRGKKLLGRKVGRSWYVELDSTAAFFGGEAGSVPQAPLVAKAVPEKLDRVSEVKKETEYVEPRVEPVARYVTPSVQTSGVLRMPEERIKVNKAFVVEDAPRESVHIPVRIQRPSYEIPVITAPTSSLQYIQDDEPYVPIGRRFSERSLAAAMVMPRTEEEAAEIIEDTEEPEQDTQIYSTPKRRSSVTSAIFPALRVFVLGAIVLGIVVGSSVLISSQMIIEAGKAASVGYSVK